MNRIAFLPAKHQARHFARRAAAGVAICVIAAVAPAQPAGTTSTAFANYETPVIHPVDLSPDGRTLAVVNLPAARLDLFDVSGGEPVALGSIPVGLDPASVRFRTAGEAWVVNTISDNVTVVDVAARRTSVTLAMPDAPADVVFADPDPLVSPALPMSARARRAFVSCAGPGVDCLQVVDLVTSTGRPFVAGRIPILGDRPKSLAVSPDGARVHAAIYESGNATTLVPGGASSNSGLALTFPPDSVSNASSPYGGVNPVPNGPGGTWLPPLNPANPAPPKSAMIVRKNPLGAWTDDRGTTWTDFISGANSAVTARVPGWDMPDRDLATVNAATLAVEGYTTGLMNICMAAAVNPANGRVAVVGTDALNEIRFEPNLNGRFLKVLLALAETDPSSTAPAAERRLVTDLNAHLDYATSQVAPAMRARSLGDPRGVAFTADGIRLYVTGMGSDNLVALDGATGARVGPGGGAPLPLGQGTTGLALDEPRRRAYVLNRFDSSISAVDLDALAETARVRMFDPTPPAIRAGRPFLYSTKASGTGHVSCGSCHIDGRMDRLAWDLGDPAGEMINPATDGHNLGGNISLLGAFSAPIHPMKGPMVTQTLQGIVGVEPHHWRGDRTGLEAFAGTFPGVLGSDAAPTTAAMQAMEAMVATILYPPNPDRAIDNTIPVTLPLPGQTTTNRFGTAGRPLPAGSPRAALTAYTKSSGALDAGFFSCAQCHTLPTGAGTNKTWNGTQFVDIAPGPLGEAHTAIVSVDGSANVMMKNAQLRNIRERVGYDLSTTASRAGFGYSHDGGVDTIARFMAEPRFGFTSDQNTADMVALMMAFAGGDFQTSDYGAFNNPPGPASADSHAAVGRQATWDGTGAPPTVLDTMVTLAAPAASRVDVAVAGWKDGLRRGWAYDRVAAGFVSDRPTEVPLSAAALKALASPDAPQTWTVAMRGTSPRLVIDRDGDGFADRLEIDSGTNPDDPASSPATQRATMAYDRGDGTPDGDDTRLTTVTRTGAGGGVRAALAAVLAAPPADVADVVWHVESGRPGYTSATLKLTWDPAETAGFSPADLASMKVFKAPSQSGPYVPLPTVIDVPGRTATVTVTGFSWFALAKSTVPVQVTGWDAH